MKNGLTNTVSCGTILHVLIDRTHKKEKFTDTKILQVIMGSIVRSVHKKQYLSIPSQHSERDQYIENQGELLRKLIEIKNP